MFCASEGWVYKYFQEEIKLDLPMCGDRAAAVALNMW